MIARQLLKTGETPSQLAKRLKMKHPQLSLILSGDCNWTVSTAIRILHKLGVKPRLEFDKGYKESRHGK